MADEIMALKEHQPRSTAQATAIAGAIAQYKESQELNADGQYRSACDLGMSTLITLERELGPGHPAVLQMVNRQLCCTF